MRESTQPKVGMSFTRHNGRDQTENGGAYVGMKVLIGVDPHKATLAVAVVDEVAGELIECASFPQNLEKA